MKAKIIGLKDSSFTPKDSDKPILGKTLYICYPSDKVEGFRCESVFATLQSFVNGYVPKVSDEIVIEYNRYGKPDAIYPV